MAVASRTQGSPIEAVVEMLRGVVEYGSRGSSDQVLEARVRGRRPRDEPVQVVDVCAVMLPPVVLERLRGDVRHQGVMGVGQCGQDVSQFSGLLEAVPRTPTTTIHDWATRNSPLGYNGKARASAAARAPWP